MLLCLLAQRMVLFHLHMRSYSRACPCSRPTAAAARQVLLCQPLGHAGPGVQHCALPCTVELRRLLAGRAEPTWCQQGSRHAASTSGCLLRSAQTRPRTVAQRRPTPHTRWAHLAASGALQAVRPRLGLQSGQLGLPLLDGLHRLRCSLLSPCLGKAALQHVLHLQVSPLGP